MIINWNNYIDDATLTESSSKSGYAVNNAKIANLSRQFRFDGNSGNLVIDLGAAKQITSITIGNTNVTSSGTLTIEANTSDSWGSPAYSQGVTVDDNTTNQILVLNQTYRYWRIVLSDSSVTDLQIGHIFIGTYLTMPGFLLTKSEPERTTSYGSRSLTLQWYGNRGLRYKNPSFEFPVVTETQKNNISTMFDDVQNTEPVYLIVYENDISDRPPLFCIINQDNISFEQEDLDHFSCNIEFLEVK